MAPFKLPKSISIRDLKDKNDANKAARDAQKASNNTPKKG